MAPGKNELIDSAQRYVQKGQLDKAIKDYQQALQIDSGDIQTRLRLGDVFAKKGAVREAIEQYFRVAERHAADGFYLKAIAVHKQILKLDPAHIESSSRLADLYHKQGLLSDALTTYQQVAAVYDKKGQVREALDTLTKMADLDPQNVAIRVKLGDLYLKANIKESGVEQLLKAAELYGQTGKRAEQDAVFERLLAAGPLSPAATRAIVTALIAAGKVEPALSRVNALVARAPDDPELRELQAEACHKAGQTAKAVEALTAALQGAPHRVEARQRLVELYVEAGDPEAAAAAASGFTPEGVPPEQLAAAADAVSALASRTPALPDEVRAALLRQLAAIHEARGDADGRASALASLAALTGGWEAPTLDQPGGVPAEAAVDRPAAPAAPDATPLEPARAADELTIEIDAAAPLGDAAPLDAVVDTAASELMPEGAEETLHPVAAQGADFGLDTAVDALSLDGGADGALDLSLDLDAGADTAPLDGPALDVAPLDGMPLDVAPLDTPTVDGAARGAMLPLEDEGPRGRAAGSPEASVLAGGDVELALDQIPEELDEAEFFVQQGLFDAARAIYRRILAVDPDHPVARERLDRLAKEAAATGPLPDREAPAAPESPAQAAGTRSSPDRDLPGAPRTSPPAGAASPSAVRPEEEAHEQFDLAAVLASDADGLAAGLLGDPEEQVSFQEVFREFKKGVERQVGDDPETHYNLGIAYKEMGLVEDAIAEFERALADPRRSFDCYTMIGLAHLARGDAESAIAAFETGLGHADGDPRQVMALTYELGVAFEAAGRLDEARSAFATVAAADRAFRDVSHRLAALGAAEEPAHDAGETFDPQDLLRDDLAYAPEAPAPAAEGVAAKPAPARPSPAAPRAPARPAGPVSSPARAVPGATPGAKRDRISFV
ncbi:MAG TPA: tetratricopeptide repeat protein [Thermodesulfobacteriota bacterium]